jgi:hypothetical protein
VEFFWSPFLVKLETKDNKTKALELDQLPPMLQRTLGADVLIFRMPNSICHSLSISMQVGSSRVGRKDGADGR